MDVVSIMMTIEFVTIIILFFLLVYSSMQRPSEMQRHIAILTISCIMMIVGYIIETNATNAETAMVGAGVSCIGKPYIMLSSYLLTASFYGHKLRKTSFVLLCVYCSVFPLIVLTNNYHFLYFSSVGFNADALFTPLVLSHGPLYILNILNALIYFPACIIEIVIGSLKINSRIHNRLSIYLVMMVLSGLLGYMLYVMKLNGGYDTTILGVSLGTYCMLALFFRCRIFDIVDESKDYAIDTSPEGIVVFSDSNSVLFTNKTADRIIEELIPMDDIEGMPDGENICHYGEATFCVKVDSLTKGKDFLGKRVEINDITESYNYRIDLEKAIEETENRLHGMQRTVFGSIASMVESRSVETGDHIRRVSEYTEMIAKELRKNEKYGSTLTDEYISTLVLSAPLHDVGKISVPDTILKKPGKLTAEEFDTMKGHSDSGAKIIRTIMQGLESEEYINMAADIAQYHHERWDGSGYPRALKGEEIPLCARIVAIADCFDAITSKHCYKDAVPPEKALEIIREEQGTHFDPEIASTFISVCEKQIG